MAKGAYILKIGADISAVEAAVKAARGDITSIGDNKVLIQIDYDHGDINDIRAAIQKIADYDPKVRVQVQYDLESATLRQKLEEQKENVQLLDFFKKQKAGGDELDQYVSDVCQEIYRGLDDGLSKVDLSEKLKKVLDIQRTFKAHGGELSLDVQDLIFDLQEELKLDDYKGNIEYFRIIQENVEKSKSIIKGLELQLEDLRRAGAIDTNEVIDFSGAEKTVQAVDEVNNKINETKESVSQKGKVVIFDGIREQTYDVIEDIDALMEKLEEMAKKMNLPVFQAGDLRKETVNSEDFLPGDSLKFTLSRGTGRSPGTGQYFASNLVDVIEWLNSHIGEGFDRGLFATDLSKYGDLLKIPTADYYSDLLEFFGSIHALISDGIVDVPKTDYNGNPKKKYKNYSDILNGRDISDIFDEYQSFFSDFDISLDQFIGFINDERSNLRGLADQSSGFDDLMSKLSKNDAFGTKFLKRFTKYNGIDATNLDMDDSTASGNLVFSIDKQNPFDINFGGNEDIARKFYSMVLKKILSSKAKNSDNDIDELINNFVDDTQRQLMGDNKISSIQDEISAVKKDARQLTFGGLNTSEEEISGIINQLERLQQLQQTINNMKPESAYGKSYEEAGKHIEKLNAQYEQTVAEIERLREADDGSQEIKEQIGLLENLAVAYHNAINASIPNDVSPGSWISRYTNISKEELFGDSRKAKYNKIKQGADEFRNSLDRGILDIYKGGNLSNADLVGLSQETINTSALSEIPEIMDRITSAGKEATQTMEQFGNAVSGEGGGIGDTSNEEVNALREELEEAHRRNRNQADIIERIQDDKYREEDRADQAERDLERAEQRIQELEQQAEHEKTLREAAEEMEAQSQPSSTASAGQSDTDQTRENTEETERNTEATEENTEAHKENQGAKQESSTSGAQEADTDSMRENTAETEKNTEAQKENKEAKEGAAATGRQEAQTDQTREDTEETERNTQAHKENRESKESTGQEEQTSSSTQQTKEDTEETEKNTKAHQENREERERAADTSGPQSQQTGESAQQTASDIQAEIDALNSLGATAIAAAMNKDKVKDANISLASQIIGSSVPAIEKEAAALKELASAAGDAAKAKKDYSNAGKSQSSDKTRSTESKTKTDPAKEAEAKATADAEDLVKRINELRSRRGDYLKNLQFMSVNGMQDNTASPVTKSVNAYENEVRSVISAVNELKGAWKDQNNAVNEAERAAKQFLSDMSVTVSRDDIVKQAQQQIDTIDRAIAKREQQGSGFTGDYRKRLDEARQAAVEIAEAAGNLNLDDSFNTSGVQEWIAKLNEGRITIKEINDQANILATETQLNKLLGKVNNDIGKGGLKGSLAQEYAALKERIEAAAQAARECTDATELQSKVDLGKIVSDYQRLEAAAKEAGQLQGGFSSKFAEAINNQSAQFLATYFSFQDIIRYSKQIAQTVIGTDSALIELKKVSDASNDRIQQSFTKSAETAQELGSTITDVINSTADWSRLGYSVDDAEELAKTTTMFQTVGDNMTQETASEALVSTLKGFQMDADQAMSIVDKFNEVTTCCLAA